LKSAPWNIVYSDVLGFFEKAIAPGFPYIDKLIEYPVLTGIFVQVMGFVGGTRAGYYFLSAFFLVLFGVIATYFLYKIAAEDKDKNKKLLIYWIFAPSMFVFFVYNWDIIAILFSILAFYFVQKKNNAMAAFFLALGFVSKFFPIIYLPILLIKQKNAKEWVKIISVFLITAISINGYFALSNFTGWSYFFSLNSVRNSNPDSIWTVLRFFIFDFSVNQINTISLILFVMTFGWLIWRFRKAQFMALCFIATILFLLFNKVFSPQYVLWLLPFLTILPLNIKAPFYALELSNLAALFAILPWFFTKDINYFYASIPFVIIRHAALFVILVKAIGLARISDNLPEYSARRK
ncbi:MAG: glycosyltransferase 87 family protein, partial [Patescibacteria group bacterium]